jgi:hypothetical protein
MQKENTFHSVSDLSRSHRAHDKEHTQTKKSSKPEKKKKNQNINSVKKKKKKKAYSNFIPLDLTKMVVSWENKTFSSETKSVSN